jgi:rhodanese-related sulfurtransferase
MRDRKRMATFSVDWNRAPSRLSMHGALRNRAQARPTCIEIPMDLAMTPNPERRATALADAPIERSATEALALARQGAACLIDIRQPFELELKGALPDALHVPFFHFKQHLGLSLDEEEQEILDADAPGELDQREFIDNIEQLEQHRDVPLMLVCNSGRRSLIAAHLLRGIGYPQAYSVQGGMHALLHEIA